LIVTAYLTASPAEPSQRNSVLAAVGRAVASVLVG